MTDGQGPRLGEAEFRDAEVLWDFHRMGHRARPCSVGIALGSHDLGVATAAAGYYRAGLFPLLVLSGGNSPGTLARFPRGEAVHYREHALGLGVPDAAILVEPESTNTGENIRFSRELLARADIGVESVLLVSKPYMERRAYATCRRQWPGVEVVCASEPVGFGEYLKALGDDRLVVNMMVGDLQRLIEYPKLGFSVEQDVPGEVYEAFERLVRAGFDRRLLGGRSGAGG
jgi:uncharacterized SAM-binding protein YcdF (DUF218 family)